MLRIVMAKAKGLSNIEKKSGARKRTRQGLGRGTKFSTRVLVLASRSTATDRDCYHACTCKYFKYSRE